MKIFLDTNVLVSAVIKQHTFHERSFSVFNSVLAQTNEGSIAAHTLAEMYAVLTKLPPPFAHTPEQAWLSIEQNVLKHFKTISLKRTDYAAVLRQAAAARIKGGTIYDALLLKCAEVAAVDRIFTLNLRHFRTLASPDTARKLSEP